jgi:cytochrome P450
MTEVAEPAAGTGAEAPGLPVFPPNRSRCPMSIPQEYAGLRESDPVLRVTNRMTGKPAWALTRHADVRAVLGNRTMSSDGKKPMYPHQFPVPEEMIPYIAFPFSAMDPPGHTARRRIIIPEFTARRIQDLRPRMQQIVDTQIDGMLAKGGVVDLVQELAAPVPSLLFCEMLGADPADIGYFRRYAEVTMNRDSGVMEVGIAMAEMDQFLEGLITAKEKEGGDDLLSRMVAKNNEDKALDVDDLVAISRVLVIAGFDTTTNMIALGTVTLLENPEQLAMLQADPSLAPKAVEELLRYLSIVDSATVRVATEEVELSGVTVRAGDGILALNGAANWDPSVFPDPERFDITRDAREHLAFSYGVHQCLGANLARVQLEIVFNTLFARIPGLRLATPVDELPFMHSGHVYGLYELPVTW